jgi:hypothetical protein
VNVCGVMKGACVPGHDPGRQHKRSAREAGLALGLVQSPAMLWPLPATGRQPEVPGRQLQKFKVTARLIAELYPRLTNARRWNFQSAIAAHPACRLAPPAVLWDMLNEATVTMEYMACDTAAGAEIVRTIIRQIAEADAQIGVREIKVVKISSADQRAREVRHPGGMTRTFP